MKKLLILQGINDTINSAWGMWGGYREEMTFELGLRMSKT